MKRFLPIIVIGVVGLLVYSDTFHNSFHFDDYPEIINNASIRDIHHPLAIWNFWPTRFIAGLSFALNFHWGGLNVTGYHVVSLLIHLAASIMVWWLVSMTVDAPWLAFFAGLIFLTHPLQTQPVNYIYQRAALLAGFFYLSSLALYVKARKTYLSSAAPRPWMVYLACSLVAAVLSMFSKESAVSLPLTVALYEGSFFKGRAKPAWPWLLPFFVAALLLPLTWTITHPNILRGTKQVVENYAGGISIKDYVLTQPRVILTYVRLLLLPVHQTVEYDFPLTKSMVELPFILSVLSLLAVLWAAFRMSLKYRLVSFGVLFFFITLLPESSLWPNKDVIFEHRLYLPMAGFSIFACGGLFYMFGSKVNTVVIRILVLLVLIYAVMTYQRNKIWANEFTLWDDAVHQSPQSSRAYLNRGACYQKQGDLDHALADYNMVIGLGPVDAVTLSNRGSIFRSKGNFNLAMANFNLAIKVNPNYAGTYINRALLYQTEGNVEAALSDFNKAVALMPYNASAYSNRGLFYEQNARFDLALDDFNQAIAMAGDDPEFYGDRASVYFAMKHYDKSWDDVHRAERLGAPVKSQYLEALRRASGREQ